jgi:hypothetical protein
LATGSTSVAHGDFALKIHSLGHDEHRGVNMDFGLGFEDGFHEEDRIKMRQKVK